MNSRSSTLPRYLWQICFVASLGGILFGFDTAVISGTFAMVEQQYNLNQIQVGWFGSAALIGAIIGAFMAGGLSDRHGRKPILLIAAALFFVSALLSAIPPNFTFLIAARIIGGLGVGMASVLSPMYISEISPPHIRGRLVALYQMSIVLGIMLAYFSNYLLLADAQPGIATSHHSFWKKIINIEIWRSMFLVETIPSGLFFLLLLWIPESPRWLLNNGFVEQAQILFKKLNTELIAPIEDKKHQQNQSKSSILHPQWRKALLVGLGLSIFGQFTGVNIVIYYGPTILENAGFELDSAVQFQVLIGIINLIFTAIALWKIDKWGRKPLLIGGMTAVFLSLCGIGWLFTSTESSGILIVVLLCIYIASLALSINAVIWVLLGEIYPNHIRGQAMSLATFANWASNFGAAFLFPYYVSQVGMSTGFFTFAASCLVAIFFFYKMIPETKGMSLEDIENYWIHQHKR
ncbi:sugar porter family MFS transporter [Membranihabitans marinus]|uniref:sugar porter family MFS transporter n=1 Tax=Membranihabitans marinus TaxID=1227546 RepID=UPI001F3E00F6|nr:sugar porter family MFS transporter [Membranihabitans marinus]